MKRNDTSVNLYSLGLEELSMALGLVNRPDMGKQLLESIYDNLTETQIESRLSSASHSLLARGLAAISEKGGPVLEGGLEQALFPLIRFDYVLQISRVRDGKQVGATVHVQKGKSFTSHSIQAGVVHVLEHGSWKNLANYLMNTFPLLDEKGIKTEELPWPVTPGILGEALRGGKLSAIIKILVRSGMPSADAENLAEDLAHQTLRGTILRVKANGEINMEKLAAVDKQMVMILSGKARNWLFEFNSTSDASTGKIWTINRQNFQKRIESFAS